MPALLARLFPFAVILALLWSAVILWHKVRTGPVRLTTAGLLALVVLALLAALVYMAIQLL